MSLRDYLIARGKEASTWRAVVALASLGAYKLSPDQLEAIVTIGVLASGAIGATFPDAVKPPDQQPPSGDVQ